MRTGGTVLVCVWSKEEGGGARCVQVEGGGPQDIFVPWKLQRRFVGGDGLDRLRYYYLFRKGELEKDVLEATRGTMHVKIEASGFAHQNWWTIIRKL